MLLALFLAGSLTVGQTSNCPEWSVLPSGDVICWTRIDPGFIRAGDYVAIPDQIDRPLQKPPLSCADSLWKVIRESIDVLAGVKVRQGVVPTLRAAAEACE